MTKPNLAINVNQSIRNLNLKFVLRQEFSNFLALWQALYLGAIAAGFVLNWVFTLHGTSGYSATGPTAYCEIRTT